MEREAWALLAFADPLRRMLHAGLGLSWHEMHERKEAPLPALDGVTPRRLMQTLGTEWGRQMILPDLWVRVWRRAAAARLGDGVRVVCPDVRMPDEAAAIWRLGGIVVWVDRPLPPSGDTHESERAFSSEQCDRVLRNDGDLAALAGEVRALLQLLGHEA